MSEVKMKHITIEAGDITKEMKLKANYILKCRGSNLSAEVRKMIKRILEEE